MVLHKRKLAHVKEHYRRFSEEALDDAMGIAPSQVAALRGEAGLQREKGAREHAEEEAPLYTAQAELPYFPRLGWPDYVLGVFCALLTLVVYVPMLGSTVTGEDIDLRINYVRGLRSVEADSSQVEQIIMNLAVNVRDAMADGAILDIEVGNGELVVQYICVTPRPG